MTKDKHIGVFYMGSITQKLKYKQLVIKFSYEYGATKVAIKFCECKKQ